jgi:superfamily II DNA or RNA helicase/uncharacterized tellurite resistance protein B-like protein
MTRARDIRDILSSGDVERGVTYVTSQSPTADPIPALYRHQIEALAKLERQGSPPTSGIVHLPTGGGKTRIGLEFIARVLRTAPNHRFIWSTHSLLLIEQTIARLAELSNIFPSGTLVKWLDRETELTRDLGHITFVTRDNLRYILESANSNENHQLRRRITSGKPTTLIYDECHQLGAEQLQKQFRKFYRAAVEPAARPNWRVIGLSATPVPTRQEARSLLQKKIFKPQPAMSNVPNLWDLHIVHQVTNQDLIQHGVLCPINLHMDQSGLFDLPESVLRSVIRDARITPPGPNARKEDVVDYASKFNRSVMGNDRVLSFLAERLAANLNALGKTIVFASEIEAADRLVNKLHSLPGMRGKVAVVHSQMRQQEREKHPDRVLAKFRARGSEPCILVNVEMLTEGFDDPQVRTIVLAKLTLSSNRFWQMIGRGTRGTRAGGTADCFVIDPIKLIRLYDYFNGYQPSVGRRPGSAIEDDPEDSSESALDPSVPAVSRPPLPSRVTYVISPQLRRQRAKVAAAVEAFIRHQHVSEDQLIEIAKTVDLTSRDGQVVVDLSSSEGAMGNHLVLLLEEISRMQARMGAELGWLNRFIPTQPDEPVFRFWHRRLGTIESLGIRTEDDYHRAESSGRFASILHHLGSGGYPPTPSTTMSRPEPDVESLVVVLSAVAHADGRIHTGEQEVAAQVIVDLTGLRSVETLVPTLSPTKPDPRRVEEAARLLASQLDERKRLSLIRNLFQLAAADGIIDRAEVDIIASIGAYFGHSKDAIELIWRLIY